MTSRLAIVSFAALVSGLALSASPAAATEAPDPCVLGSGATGSCAGPVRVTREIVIRQDAGAAMVQHHGHGVASGAAPVIVMTPAAPAMAAPMYGQGAAPGCIPASPAQPVACNGDWIVVQTAPPAVAPPPYVVPGPAPMLPPPPQQTALTLPASFFPGPIANGVGFNTTTGYTYGSGGVFVAGGGTRFSGVRERAPWPLVPPPRHNPPPHRPPCCHH